MSELKFEDYEEEETSQSNQDLPAHACRLVFPIFYLATISIMLVCFTVIAPSMIRLPLLCVTLAKNGFAMDVETLPAVTLLII